MELQSLWRGVIDTNRPSRDGFKQKAGRIPRHVLTEEIANVCEDWNVAEHKILSASRVHKIAHARHDLCWRLRQYKWPGGIHRYSFPAIAEAVNYKDHTDALNAMRAHGRRSGLGEA